jgi:hypothetical protein
MIVFDLRCPDDHRFEAWFASGAAYEEQQARGLVTCPSCGSADIGKAVMAPAVAAKGNSGQRARAAALAAFRAEVEARCDYVGRDFARVARARFEAADTDAGEAEGGAPPRGVYGEASLAEAAELLSDGIPIAPLPFRPRRLADA